MNRLKGLTLLAGLLLVAGCASGLERRFQGHVNYLASEELEGRGIGTRGIDLAADYIANAFAGAGLQPAGDEGTYYQTFPVALRRELNPASRLVITGDAVERRLGEDYIPFSFSGSGTFDGAIVFCGYGIVAEDRGHDDFADLNLNGRVALMLRHEPPHWAGERGEPSWQAMLRNKVYAARERGASAVLLVNPRSAEGEPDELTGFRTDDADAYGIPAFHITRAMADAFLRRGGLGSLDELQDRMDAGSFVSAPLAHIGASGEVILERVEAPVKNVVAVLPGAGPHADECIVIGAHYDHLGIREPMMREFRDGRLVRQRAEPQIHYGADDNASGVGALIEIAAWFGHRPHPPGRTLVFAAFTAEEIGLHGSRFYVENPACPLDRTIAMLNMDMVGRMDPQTRKLEVFGLTSAEAFGPIVHDAAQREGLTVLGTTDTGGRSDHAPFIRSNIPAMHFFSGHHPDYHKPADVAEKINARGGAAITRLVAEVADRLAALPERPAFVAAKGSGSMAAGDAQGDAPMPTFRVVMGLAPSYADDGTPGMGVDAVNADGPAELAGIRRGDRIIRIGNLDVANIYDYMASTRNNRPGDVVEVVVLRDGKEMTLSVTLSAAR